MREPPADRAHVLGDVDAAGAAALRLRPAELGATVEGAVLDPCVGDVGARTGIGARRMAGDQIVDFETIFDLADTFFQAFRHNYLPFCVVARPRGGSGNFHQEPRRTQIAFPRTSSRVAMTTLNLL